MPNRKNVRAKNVKQVVCFWVIISHFCDLKFPNELFPVCHLRVLATKHLATGEVENIAETRDCAPAKPEYSCEGKRLGAPTADDETLKTDCICDTDLCNGAHHEMDHMEYDGGVTKNPRVDTVVRNGAPRTTATFIIAAMVIFSSALFQLVI